MGHSVPLIDCVFHEPLDSYVQKESERKRKENKKEKKKKMFTLHAVTASTLTPTRPYIGLSATEILHLERPAFKACSQYAPLSAGLVD